MHRRWRKRSVCKEGNAPTLSCVVCCVLCADAGGKGQCSSDTAKEGHEPTPVVCVRVLCVVCCSLWCSYLFSRMCTMVVWKGCVERNHVLSIESNVTSLHPNICPPHLLACATGQDVHGARTSVAIFNMGEDCLNGNRGLFEEEYRRTRSNNRYKT